MPNVLPSQLSKIPFRLGMQAEMIEMCEVTMSHIVGSRDVLVKSLSLPLYRYRESRMIGIAVTRHLCEVSMHTSLHSRQKAAEIDG